MHRRIFRVTKILAVGRAVGVLLLAAISVVSVANCQQPPGISQKPLYGAGPDSLPIAIARVKKGDFSPLDVEIIAKWHGIQAIPLLERQFEQSKDDSIMKGKIANALVRLGDTNGLYWGYLVNQARQVLDVGPPTPWAFDENGKALPGDSKNLTEWAKKHHMSIQNAYINAIFVAPGPILELGTSDDKRAIPLLRKALASDNALVVVEAAEGLAEFYDTASVPAIIQACENAPKEEASQIAQSLVYFNDPAAKRAVDEYVPKSTAQVLREAVAHGKTPYH